MSEAYTPSLSSATTVYINEPMRDILHLDDNDINIDYTVWCYNINVNRTRMLHFNNKTYKTKIRLLKMNTLTFRAYRLNETSTLE